MPPEQMWVCVIAWWDLHGRTVWRSNAYPTPDMANQAGNRKMATMPGLVPDTTIVRVLDTSEYE